MRSSSTRYATPFAFACLLLAIGNLATADEKIKLGAAGKFSYPPEFPGARVETYKQLGDVALKLYIFAPPAEAGSTTAAADARRPAIIFFFGGGWTNGSPTQFYNQCRYFASRGMVAITADYRVASRNQTKVVDCVRDAKSAVRWVREHASQLGVDPDRIVASGGSAGGHLAACTAVVESLDHEGETTAVSAKPNALVLFNPAMGLVERGDGSADEKVIAGLRERIGGDPREVSPADLVKAGVPPTIMFFGTDDNLLGGAKRFADACQKVGGRCELDLYEGQRHGFFNAGRNDNEFFRKTLVSADKFLASLGYLKGEPTVDQVFE
jgi:acetyl esterase/lipase